MSKASKRAQQRAQYEAKAKAGQSVAPDAEPSESEDLELTDDEAPESPQDESVTVDEPSLEPAVEPTPEPKPEPAVAKVGASVMVALPPLRPDPVDPTVAVRCEALTNVFWRGAVAPPGTVITVDPKNVDRLVSKGIVKRV